LDRGFGSCHDVRMSTSRSELEALAAQLDHSNMRVVIEGIPRQIETALAQTLPPLPGGPFTRAIIAGMGGSALPADVVVATCSDRLLVPVTVVRNYRLPPVDEHCLVIASSFSGSTEETLSTVEHLPRDLKNVVVVTSGGKLQAIAQQRGYGLIRIPVEREPAGFQPRCAVGYSVTYFMRALAAAGLMPDPAAEMTSVASFLRSVDVRKDAEETARWLKDKIPVVYTDERHMMSIGRLSKIKLNENAKRAAFFNSIPEANHNEMIGFVQPVARFGVLYLHDRTSMPRIRQRFRVMADIFARSQLAHVSCREWTIPGETTLERTFAALVFSEWASYSLALLDGFDPTPVDLVEGFKTALVADSQT